MQIGTEMAEASVVFVPANMSNTLISGMQKKLYMKITTQNP